MKSIFEILKNCVLFKGLTIEEIEKLLKSLSYSLDAFSKNEVIALEESKCTSIGIILDGKVEIQKIFPSGKIFTLNTFSAGNKIGRASCRERV